MYNKKLLIGFILLFALISSFGIVHEASGDAWNGFPYALIVVPSISIMGSLFFLLFKAKVFYSWLTLVLANIVLYLLGELYYDEGIDLAVSNRLLLKEVLQYLLFYIGPQSLFLITLAFFLRGGKDRYIKYTGMLALFLFIISAMMFYQGLLMKGTFLIVIGFISLSITLIVFWIWWSSNHKNPNMKWILIGITVLTITSFITYQVSKYPILHTNQVVYVRMVDTDHNIVAEWSLLEGEDKSSDRENIELVIKALKTNNKKVESNHAQPNYWINIGFRNGDYADYLISINEGKAAYFVKGTVDELEIDLDKQNVYNVDDEVKNKILMLLGQ